MSSGRLLQSGSDISEGELSPEARQRLMRIKSAMGDEGSAGWAMAKAKESC